MDKDTSETLRPLFANRRATLKDIERDGWTFVRSRAELCFQRFEGDRDQQVLPVWMKELLDEQYQAGGC